MSLDITDDIIRMQIDDGVPKEILNTKKGRFGVLISRITASRFITTTFLIFFSLFSVMCKGRSHRCGGFPHDWVDS